MYLNHLTVWTLHHHSSCATDAVTLDPLALQLHVRGAVLDYTDRFLESDTLQRSLRWCRVNDALGWFPWFLQRQQNKQKDRRIWVAAQKGCKNQSKLCLSKNKPRTTLHCRITILNSSCVFTTTRGRYRQEFIYDQFCGLVCRNWQLWWQIIYIFYNFSYCRLKYKQVKCYFSF